MKMLLRFLLFVLLLALCLPSGTLANSSSTDIRKAQELLTRAGFDPGPADGKMGGRTQEALRKFQVKHSLPATGSLDEATWRALEIKDDHAAEVPPAPQDNKELQRNGNDRPERSSSPRFPAPLMKQIFYKEMTKADTARLAVLVALGIGALSVGGLFLYTFIGAGIIWALHWIGGWPFASSALAGLASAYVIPLLLSTLLQNPRMTLAFGLFFGIPAFLISKFIVGSDWLFAAGESLALMHLLPSAVLRSFMRTGIVKVPQRADEPSHIKYESRTGTSPHLASNDRIYRSGAPSTGSSSSPVTSGRRW